jgi:predicted Zn-dependent protease
VGNQFLESVRKQFSMAEDDFANEYLNDLGQYLVKNLETEPFPFRFYVVQNSDVNAFAGPGGHIFFYTGLILAMDGADELAAVLCHEMGHVAARHLSNRIEQNKKIAFATLAGMLAGALIGGKAAGAIMTGTMAANMQQQLNYSREDERQADQLGFKYMNLSGFDPGGMVNMLKILEKMQWQGANALPSYLLTHPGGSERILNTESMMTSYEASKENGDVRKFRKLFPYLKSLRGVSHLSKIGLRVRPSVEGEGRVWKGDRLPGEGIKRRPVIPSHSEESR